MPTRLGWPQLPSNAHCLPPRKEKRSHADTHRTDSERYRVPPPAGEENVLRGRRRSRKQHGHYLVRRKSGANANWSFLVRANTIACWAGRRLRQCREMPPGALLLRNDLEGPWGGGFRCRGAACCAPSPYAKQRREICSCLNTQRRKWENRVSGIQLL